MYSNVEAQVPNESWPNTRHVDGRYPSMWFSNMNCHLARLPSGKHTKNDAKSPCYLWVNQL